MKISLITVCYNSEAHLRSTIESVLHQTYPDIEYILIDGNSQDHTVDIIREYEPAFHGRLKWISEPDQGIYDAMNKGIRMAIGEIVGILNSDDFYTHPACLETIAGVFEDAGMDSCFADVRFVKPENLDQTVRYYSSAKFNPAKFRWGFMPAHPTFFVRKKYFDEMGYYKTDYRIAADFELLIRFLYVRKLSYRYLPLDLVKMRMGGRSTQSWKSNYILNKEIVRACKENGIYTHLFILLLKYFRKIVELIRTKN
ncbi:PGL/p-HBAD biosynthesis glycosyltransferase [termite gut metagenome]|uniref:PGL/p-HBAD biosynthesis glycosyltransferase n=1 Tax=termite gut metagenome TaxID=433724 RepID=A0A5J4T0H1_9ZZZZ